MTASIKTKTMAAMLGMAILTAAGAAEAGINEHSFSATSSVLDGVGSGYSPVDAVLGAETGGGLDDGTAASAKGGGVSPKVRSMLLSLLIPGLGQYVAGDRTWSYVFFGAEAAIWISYAGFKSQGSSRDDRVEEYAHVWGNVQNPSGQSETYYTDMGKFASYEEYRVVAIRGGEGALYDEAQQWVWPNEERRIRYRDLRAESEQSDQNAEVMIFALLINRALSVVHAARTVSNDPTSSLHMSVLPDQQGGLMPMVDLVDAVLRSHPIGYPMRNLASHRWRVARALVLGGACFLSGCSGGGAPEIQLDPAPAVSASGDAAGAEASRLAPVLVPVFVRGRDYGLVEPVDLVVDPSGLLVVLDTSVPDVARFDFDGRLVSRWPISGTSERPFIRPRALSVSGLSLLMMDPAERVILRYNLEGRFQGEVVDLESRVISDRLGFFEPADLAADDIGQIFFTDTDAHRVVVFDERTVSALTFGTFGPGVGQLRTPQRVSSDAEGRIYVVDSGNDRIQRFDSFGAPMGQFQVPILADGTRARPVAVAPDTRGGVYILDDSRGLTHLSHDGTRRRWTVSSGLVELAVHPDGRVFALGRDPVRVEAFDPDRP